MSLTWLLLGGVIGAIGSRTTDTMIGFVSSILGGMIVLLFAGMFLGLIGGDVKGTPVGAAGALFGCWLSQYGGTAALDPLGMKFMVLVGALAGATCFLYLRLILWTYKTVFRTAYRLCFGTQLPVNVFGRLVRFQLPSRLPATAPVHFTVPPSTTWPRHRLGCNSGHVNDTPRSSVIHSCRHQGNAVGG
jgi:hypothetical protein